MFFLSTTCQQGMRWEFVPTVGQRGLFDRRRRRTNEQAARGKVRLQGGRAPAGRVLVPRESITPARFELATLGLEVRCSIQLSQEVSSFMLSPWYHHKKIFVRFVDTKFLISWYKVDTKLVQRSWYEGSTLVQRDKVDTKMNASTQLRILSQLCSHDGDTWQYFSPSFRIKTISKSKMINNVIRMSSKCSKTEIKFTQIQAQPSSHQNRNVHFSTSSKKRMRRICSQMRKLKQNKKTILK